MSESPILSSPERDQGPFYTPPALPKGGGTISSGGGMLSSGGPDGAAGWSLPLPLPTGREVSPSLALAYTSGGGNSAFGAGWDIAIPAIFRMNRFGIPRYQDEDRLVGADGEEILRDEVPSRREGNLPFSDATATYIATPWVSRSGGREERLEHWVPEGKQDDPGFWLCWHANGSLTIYGWSDEARLSDPEDRSRVAGWFIEETVSARGEHVVYRYLRENQDSCEKQEQESHPRVTNVYLAAVYAANAQASTALLIPEGRFHEVDFLSFMLVDYGERGADITAPPSAQTSTVWPVRQDSFSFWRYGFEVRTRRLCHDFLLWHRTKIMAGGSDASPVLVSRLHLTHDVSGVASILTAAQQVAYEADGVPVTFPPLEFALSLPGNASNSWEALPVLNGFCPPQWQMADLYGEGIPGLLYQDSGAWWYRAPERDQNAGQDAVTWGPAQPLPFIPSMRSGMLTDLDGDGKPEWLVTQPGLQGSFSLSPDGGVGSFIALEALPIELMNPSAQLADLTGGGLQDVVMIGPRSVRLWASASQKGWQQAQNIEYSDKFEQALPIAGGAHCLVAFADPAGSGQQHLVEITGDGVRYWPSLGHGRFGEPISIGGFSISNFNAERVFLGDTDGSGTTDILYIEHDRIRVFVSQSGNRFVEMAPVMAPAGIRLDNTCELKVADVRGQGTADLMLTVQHIKPRSFLYRFNSVRPWLLTEVCTNTGSRTLFDYRSSAQNWLDEKAQLLAAGKPAVSYLPFPVHTLSRLTALDDIAGQVMGSQMRYLQGVWDGHEREFRGFRHLIQRDAIAQSPDKTADISPPSEVHTWFLTGLEDFDGEPDGAFTGAEVGFTSNPVRLTRLEGELEVVWKPDEAVRGWLLRALKGRVVRSEVYGCDGSTQETVPYSITRQRWQVRAYKTANEQKPAALAIPLESLALATERIADDPAVTQSVVLSMDEFGTVLHSVDISYPRSQALSLSLYPDDLPDGLIKDSQDEQQRYAWLALQRQRVHNLRNGHDHLIGMKVTARQDVLKLTAKEIPIGGFSVETLLADGGPLSDHSKTVLAEYARVQCCDTQGNPTDQPVRQALVAWTETALLDERSLSTLRETLPDENLEQLLDKGGYHATSLPEDGRPVWVGRHNLANYGKADAFYALMGGRDNELVGETVLTWDKHYLAVVVVKDASQLQTSFDYDWVHRSVTRTTDPNDNIYEVVLDALGRVTQSRFRGTENGRTCGYGTTAFTVPQTVQEFLTLNNIPVATAHRIVSDSWMPFVRDEHGICSALRIGELKLKNQFKIQGKPLPDLTGEREPPHIISLQTDRYDGDPEQQVRIQVTFSDGGGRLLQTAILNPPGEALLRTPKGELQADAAGNAIQAFAQVRWAVNGKTEYDNKGQIVRVWQPFYLNDWRPVYNDEPRKGIFADTHVYDALGRECRVITAAGWERSTRFFPWFTVLEDENDTAQDVLVHRGL